VYSFSSYHWNVNDLSEPDRRAVAALNDASPSLPSAGYATHDEDGLLNAFPALLRSDDVRARGIALDQYRYADAQMRWTDENPFTVFEDEALAVARAMLASVPLGGRPVEISPFDVSCWNSALGILSRAGDETDLPRLFALVDLAMTGHADLSRLESMDLFWAVEIRVDEWTRDAVRARLHAILTQSDVPDPLRREAIGFLANEEHLKVHFALEDAVVPLLRHDDVWVATTAAKVLVGRPGYDHLVREVVATWDGNPTGPALETRRLIGEADELADARATHSGQPSHPGGGPGMSSPPSSAASGAWNCLRHVSMSASLIGKVVCGAVAWRQTMRAR
jgi:hypothetical protein